jgi:DNA-binding response OmpR family regulator
MKYFYIAIETSVEVFNLYRQLWKEHNIEGIRAGTMSEGIEKAIEIEKSDNVLHFISIVGDEINFLPQLSILSAETNAPILVAVSKSRYTEKEHHQALKCGADFYAPFCDKVELNIEGVLSVLECIRRQRAEMHRPMYKVIAHIDILIDIEHYRAFFKDAEVPLTSAEIRILHYMMLNRGLILSHEQIIRNAYESENKTSDSLYTAMRRLRNKIRDVAQTDYIETIRDAGYRLKAGGGDKDRPQDSA